MIALPLWLTANWKAIVGILIGAALTWPIASCQGRRDANAANEAKIIAASAKVREAAAKAEIAAMAADSVRRGQAKQVQDELREIVDEQANDDTVGPGVAAILDRLRQGSGR